jgi:hypothetical protein
MIPFFQIMQRLFKMCVASEDHLNLTHIGMSEDVNECDHFPDIGIDGRVILKLFFNK